MTSEFITGAATAIASSAVTGAASLAIGAFTKKRAGAKADRETVRAQADALIMAVTDLRGKAEVNRLLWGTRWEGARSFLVAFAAGAGAMSGTTLLARPQGNREEWLAIASGAGAAVDALARDRREAKRMDGELAPLIPRVTAAAAPLLRHPDQGVATATERLVKAAYNIKAKGALDRALREFGRAVVPVTTVPLRWWRRSSRSA